jgi:hypothetical protein
MVAGAGGGSADMGRGGFGGGLTGGKGSDGVDCNPCVIDGNLITGAITGGEGAKQTE